MNILVTGGAGYIGSHTFRRLIQRGHQAWAFDNLSMGHRESVPADRLIVADLNDVDRLDHALIEHRIEAVVHFAASAFVGESVTQPGKYYRNNVVNTLNLLERLRKHGICKFVFSSTCAPYGTPEKVPSSEDNPQRPINTYGLPKPIIEQALADYPQA